MITPSIVFLSQTLKEWVAIESVSVQLIPHLRQEVFRMMTLAADKLQHLGARVDSVDLGSQQVPGGLLPVQEPPLLWPSAIGGVKKRTSSDPHLSPHRVQISHKN